MAALPEPAPAIRMRGRSLMAVVVAPEFPMAAWFEALDAQLRATPDFLRERPVVANLAALNDAGPEAPLIALEGLEARGLRLVAVEGVPPALLAGARWASLAGPLKGRESVQPPGAERRAFAPRATHAPAALVVDQPVRSGQSFVFEAGDVIIVGAVASGAEVLAGGSIHVYGALRGRAIAGLRVGASARIFCRSLEAEMVGVGELYRTAEHWGSTLHGRPVQIRCDRGHLRLTALD